ncbi:hypothetical protein [Ammoniphilus resinae]|uniref:Uncharacterized protein n=1 Tax=Ammoniphilus resinae TaxID=861532 RepID=A0ABS4GXY8_9BACL|nr:hypothetical protein [Ammoniphilus resinae]MBP1935128.1 hypothetical protein [Ammoniphilus resinae]
MSFLKAILRTFVNSRVTPAQLYRIQLKNHSNQTKVDAKQLVKGAERQYARLHDPNFQTREMLQTLDRLVPVTKGK